MVNQLIKISIFLFSIIIILSCNSKKSENFMLLNGYQLSIKRGEYIPLEEFFLT